MRQREVAILSSRVADSSLDNSNNYASERSPFHRVHRRVLGMLPLAMSNLLPCVVAQSAN
jgi:hypothetical protein